MRARKLVALGAVLFFVAKIDGAFASPAPAISYHSEGSSLVVEVEHVGRDSVQGILWDDADITSALEELESSGRLTVTDTSDGFIVTADIDHELDGVLSFRLANEILVSSTVKHAKAERANQRALALPTIQVVGTVRYRQAGCWFWNCWLAAPNATVTLTPAAGFGVLPGATVYTSGSGWYDTGILKGCGKFTVTARYNGLSASASKTPACLLSGNTKYTINLDVK